MSFPGRSSPPRSGRAKEITLLALLLSTGVVGFQLGIDAIFGRAGGGLAHAPRDMLLSVPAALVAAWLGLRLTSRPGQDRGSFAVALNRGALISLTFMVLFVPSALIGRFFATASITVVPGVLPAGGAIPGLTAQALRSVSDALIGQVTGLPLLLAACLLLGQARPAPRTMGRRRPSRFVSIGTSLAAVAYFAGPGATMAMAGVRPASSATTASNASNPCSTAPHDTFNISAINVNMPLNRFGVHDPNAFMYVLNSNIAAVRAQEQSQQVSSGLQGGDAIQPLVIRAHEGDCVTVNLTNATTFGLAAMDQPPPPDTDPADACTPTPLFPCDGSLVHTAPENIAWNVDGLPGVAAEDVSSAIGQNADSTAAPGQTASYTVYMDPALGYGAHLFHTTGDTRQLQAHGLFGVLVSEPPGSQWLDPHTNQPLASGWDATIQMPSGASQPSFREFNLIFHSIGDEGYRQIMEAAGAPCATDQGEVQTSTGCELPVVDKFTDAYRPCAKAINYRSECFFERELAQMRAGFTPDEAQDYSSYSNGDMATPRPEAYIGDPYKILLTNADSEMGHVFHEHGGAIRWLRNPGAANPDISGGLEKFPPVTKASIRLDSQTIEPGESYDLETECGAGGCQQAAGDFLYHCHIAAHYDAGMVGFIRVFDTQQSTLATVPGRTARPQAVNSAGLIGKVIEGKTVVPQDQLTNPSTQISVQQLVSQQLPPQGTRLSQEDATVWDWTWGGTADQPIALGEPEDTHVWANYTAPNPGQRPQILFDPGNGRYAYPLLQPHLGERPPFSPNGHSGAPWLGPNVTSTRPDGLCPQGAPLRTYNISAIQTPINDQTDSGRDANGNPIAPQSDPNGEIFVLNQHIAAVRSGAMPATPLAVRSDVGDCIAVTLTNDLSPSSSGVEATSLENIFREVNIHIHFVQFDPQASDGVITGLNFEQAVRPITGGTPGETTLTAAAPAGATQLQVASTAGLRPGVSIEVGQTLTDTEVVNQITAINGNTLTLGSPLQNAHASGEPAGVEFVQYRWYSDVDNGTVFFHDHVDALSSWGHGLFGAHIIEPAGSTFHDPVTGAPIDSGPIADIYTTGSAGFGEQGDFREYVLWEHEGIRSSGSPQGCEMSSFNLRAAPLINRDPNAANPNNAPGPGVSIPDGVGNYTMGFEAHEEPAGSDRVDCTAIGTSNDPYVFSSVAHGDPPTPLLKAYVGDPVVIRQVGLDEQVGDIRVTGHRFAEERFNPNGVLTDAGTAGISEKMDYVFNAGNFPGDYLYYSGRNLSLESGAWGIFRVMNTLHTSGPNALEALPDRTPPPSGTGFPTLTTTGNAPPAAPSDSSSVCPGSAPVRSYNVSVFNGITFDKGMPGESDNAAPGSTGSWAMMYSLTQDEAAIKAGTKPAVPLVIRANAGDCLKVTLHNDLPTDNWTWTWGSGTTRAGFNIGNVLYNPQTSFGGAIGYDPDSSVPPGGSRTYVYYVDRELGTNLILNTANESTWRQGAYGALIAEPQGSVYEDPFTGQQIQSGIFADIFPGSGSPFREYVTIFSDREPLLAHEVMIYYLDSDHSYTDYNEASLTDREPADEGGGGNGNCGSSPCPDPFNLWQAKSDSVNGGNDPATPLFEAYAGDPVRWRVADAAGDNIISFQVAGHSFPLDHGLTGSQIIEARTLAPGETFDAYLVNGAGGATGATGDFEYNMGRAPLIKSGDWGIMRVLPPPFSAPAVNGKTLTRL
ncbi:MAG TPA: multicopper oxidase domain-containing protein [Streptosporangiaceae bacterium]|nr:multicopper oxidase domain-containing protein [Streptosporangiaceae bacterium]